MPKTILAADVLLLWCVSVLAASWLVSGTGPPAERWWAWAAVLLAFVLAATEWFSGLRWPALIAFAATVVGLVGMAVDDPAPGWSRLAWGVAWVAVAGWFALLTAAERSDR